MDMPTNAPGVKDPNHTAWDVVDNTPYETGSISSLGGKSKITPTSREGESYNGQTGYGFMTNDASMKAQGIETGTGMPTAKPIAIVTSGDPNNSSATMSEVK